jgi:hypothetical protein
MYLGSRPELARKDSQTYTIGQFQLFIRIHTGHSAYGSNELQRRHLSQISLSDTKSDVHSPLGSSSRTSYAKSGAERDRGAPLRQLGASSNFRLHVHLSLTFTFARHRLVLRDLLRPCLRISLEHDNTIAQ